MRFYTGTYTRMGGPGISVCRYLDGQITNECSRHDLNDPTYVILSKDAKTLFAVGSDDDGNGMAASYHAEHDELYLISKQYTGGRAACHLTLSPDERFLYVANYLSGSISVFPVIEDMLGKCIQVMEHKGSGPHLIRQEAAHTHQCVFRPGTKELFVCDLGIDQIVVYEQNPRTGMLTKIGEIRMPPGMGPRHLVFADSGCFYVTGELDNVVRHCVYRKDCWMIQDTYSTLPPEYQGESLSSAIRLQEGNLYVTNRGHDSLCMIRLGESGRMADAHWISTGGQYPRDFALTSQGMIFAHQNDGGLIAENGACLPMDGAVCVCIDHTTEKE